LLFVVFSWLTHVFVRLRESLFDAWLEAIEAAADDVSSDSLQQDFAPGVDRDGLCLPIPQAQGRPFLYIATSGQWL
jgi:hypothetical protein